MKPVGPVDTPKLLKSIRSDRGWSLDQTAAQTGVSKAMLGQIERGESMPTVATLWKIATGLGVPMTALLEGDRGEDDVLLLRDAAELRVRPSQEGMQRALLFPYEARFGFGSTNSPSRPDSRASRSRTTPASWSMSPSCRARSNCWWMTSGSRSGRGNRCVSPPTAVTAIATGQLRKRWSWT